MAAKKYRSYRKPGWQKLYRATPMGKFQNIRQAAKTRGIVWNLTFDEWFSFWMKSGHWEERGLYGYQMCRFGDDGPYAIGNIYIAHHTQNKKDAYTNGKHDARIQALIGVGIGR